jgi:hypothetical protein
MGQNINTLLYVNEQQTAIVGKLINQISLLLILWLDLKK